MRWRFSYDGCVKPLALLGMLLALASPTNAGPLQEQPPREAFESALDQVQDLLRARKWGEARELLIGAIEAAGEETFVLVHWSEVEEDLARCAFWEAYEPPGPKAVVHGELLSWNRRSGAIKLRYERANGDLEVPDADEEERYARDPGDFFGNEGAILHPLTFQGPYSIEISGRADRTASDPPVVLVAWSWSSLQGLAYGSAYAVACGPYARAFEFADGQMRLLESRYLSRNSRTFRCKVSVAASSFSVFSGKERVFKIKRPKGSFGQFGFIGADAVDEVLITGKAEPSWIAGLLDDAIQEDWKAFREGYDALAVLPAWLKARMSGESATARDPEEAKPPTMNVEDAAAWVRVSELLEKGEGEKALDLLGAIEDGKLSDVTRSWLLVRIHLQGGELEEARKDCDLVCAQAPGFYEARLMGVRLAEAASSPDEAAPLYEELIRSFPLYVEPYESLAMGSIVEGHPERASSVLQEAIANGVDPPALGRIERTIYRSHHGPSWGTSYTYESRHYRVSSDLSKHACYEIAQELEKFYKKYIVRVRRPQKRADRKFEVYFFSGFAGYADYTEDLLGDPAEGTLGLYSPWLKQLVLWNSPRKAMVMRTVRHEGFHQYLDIITSQAPVWFNEGMAEYYEQARLVKGTWKDDQIDEEHVAILKATRKDWTPLRELVYGDNRSFRRKQALHYPEAWAFCHFLFHHDRESKKRVDVLLEELAAGKTRKDALDAAFGDVDWSAMERDFEQYVLGLS